MTILIQRQAIASAAVQRFRGRALKAGTNDCVRMGAFVLRKAGLGPKLPKSGDYRSMASGLRRLKELGYDTIDAAIDGVGLVRTTLARALPSDIIGVPGEDGWMALWIALPNGRALGWHADSDVCTIIQPTLADAVVWSLF